MALVDSRDQPISTLEEFCIKVGPPLDGKDRLELEQWYSLQRLLTICRIELVGSSSYKFFDPSIDLNQIGKQLSQTFQ
jgi:hypothetical protein